MVFNSNKSDKTTFRSGLSFLLAVVALWFVVGLPQAAHATTWTVDTSTDELDGSCGDGDCSLRDAISLANADASATPGSPHIINIPAGTFTITLTGIDANNATGDFDVKEDIRLVGAGSASTTISGQAGGGDYVFQFGAGYTISIEEMTVTNNGNDSGQTTGGCLYSDSSFTILNSTFDSCKAAVGGALVIASGNTLTIDNSTFSNNTATDKGGAIRAYGITIQNGATFTNNYATNQGGAIYNATNDITINGNTLFDNNDTSQGAADRGGAIYTTTNLTLNDTSGTTTFQNNDAYCGGAINVDNSAKTLTAYGTTFTSNTTNNHGGALCIYGGDLTDVTFTNNSTNNTGGAIYSLTNDLNINGTNSFTNNDTAKLASDNGGAIYATGNVNINVTSGSTSFENNDAYCGGGINLDAALTLTIKNSTFTTNTAANIGGALCMQDATLTNVSFTSNSATNNGGAIYTNGALVLNGNNTFDSNSVPPTSNKLGGAIYSNSSITINGARDNTKTTIFQNNSAYNGGAVMMNAASAGSLFYGVDFNNNQAVHIGSAVRAKGGIFEASTFRSNDITGGTAGGAIFNDTAAMLVINSTFSENTSATGAAAIYKNGSTCTVKNSTFYQNTATGSPQAILNCTLDNSVTAYTADPGAVCTGVTDGGNNVNFNGTCVGTFGTGDPKLSALADNGGSTLTHALQAGSSLLDAGNNAVCGDADVNNTDQAGNTRDTGDGKCDIGAYEGIAAPAGPTNTFTSGTYNSSTNTLVLTGTGFDTIDAVSTDVKTYMDWTKFSWDINGDNATTANISVVVGDVTSLTITNATTLTLVFTTTKADSIEATAGVGIDGNADTLDITAGFSRDSSLNPSATDALADGTFTIDSNEFNVTKTADTADGNCTLADCSLREAITGANNVAGADTINVPDNTYTLTGASGEDSNANGDYDITGDVTIAGTSLASTIVDANSVDRVFDIKTGATVTLSNMTVKRGLIAANGGCVLTNNTLITLNTVKFDSCKGTTGGAVYAANGFHITASQFNANWATATGGAIYNTAAAGDFYGANSFTGNHADGSSTNAGGAILSNAQIITIHDSGSLFDGNYGGGSGGAIWVSAAFNISAATTIQNNYSTTNDGGGAIISKGGTITETTFKSNYSGDYGGAIEFVTTAGTISNSTFETNYVSGGADGFGGAFYANVAGTTFTNVTFSGNTAKNGGAIYNAGACTIKNSTFYDNDATTGTGDHVGCINGTVTNSVFYSATAPSTSLCYGVPNGTNNYKYNHAGSVCGASSTNADPMLSPLADNGGNSKTHAPYVGSPLLDAGDLTTCTNAPVSNLDQLGTTRDTGDSKCDIGAYEGSVAMAGVAISGTVYTDEGSTPIADGATVRLIINGVSAGTDTTVGGAYSITASPSAGDGMIVYLDGHASDGTTVTVSDSNALAGLNIYVDRLIVRHDNGGSLTNVNMSTALGAYSDAEILYTTDGSYHLTVSGANTELYVWAGDTYAPAANIDTVHMDINGTLDSAGNSITVAGNWDATGGVFTSTGSVTFDATSGTNTITPGGTDANHDFEYIAFNDGGGTATYQLAGALDVNANLTVTDGILDSSGSSHAITVGGNFTQTGGQVSANASTITISGNFVGDGSESETGYNNASLVFNGSGSSIIYSNLTQWWTNGFNNLTVGQSGVTDSLNTWLNVRNTVTIGTGELTDSGSTTLSLTSTGTALSFDAASNLSVTTIAFMKFTGTQSLPPLTNGYSCDILIGGNDLTINQTGAITLNAGKNLKVTGDGNATRVITYNTAGFTLTVGGNVNVGAGADSGAKTLDISNSTVSIAGNFTVESTGTTPAAFTSTNSTVIFNGAADQTVTTGSDAFNHLTLNNSGTNGTADNVIISGLLDINGTLTVTDGDLDISTNDPAVNTASTVNIGANGSIDVTARTANWTFDGTTTLTDGSAGQDFQDVVVNGTGLTLGSNMKAQSMTITAGTLDLGSSSYILELDGTGTPLANSGTFTAGISTVKYSGTGGATNIATLPYSSLQLTPTAASTYSLSGHQTGANAITGALTIDSNATLDATASNFNIELAGDWNNSGTFSAQNGTVTLNGTNQNVNGSTTFNNLTKSVAVADTLTFEAGQTTTVNGTLALNGASGQLLTLTSSTGSSAWNLNVTASGTKAIDYVSVSWSDASSSDASQKPISPTNSTDAGNTISWFSGPAITVNKTSTVISDPINGATNPKRFPGAIIEYTITISNVGDASPDLDSIIAVTDINTSAEVYDSTTGVTFSDGATSSALTMGTVSYSNDSGSTYAYTPSGYDTAVTNIKIPMTGTFAFGGSPSPSFTLKYRVQLK